ncbi:hypothetical protein MTP99_010303 [Tenebrio molitor]|nr:hypothetical protein MTP99_010303 [Tenebrio molitor]
MPCTLYASRDLRLKGQIKPPPLSPAQVSDLPEGQPAHNMLAVMRKCLYDRLHTLGGTMGSWNNVYLNTILRSLQLCSKVT